MTKTKERPILFNGPMVRAILAGKKTQTRRPCKPQLELIEDLWQAFYPWGGGGHGIWETETEAIADYVPTMVAHCPHGRPGDVLWVRESAYIAPLGLFAEGGYSSNATDNEGRGRAVGYAASMDGDSVRCAEDYGVKQTPSIHMPRWAARIFLRVTDVRVHRVQDIAEGDVMAEGVALNRSRYERILGAHTAFADLWAEVYGRGSWERNEWVWALTFERVDPTR